MGGCKWRAGDPISVALDLGEIHQETVEERGCEIWATGLMV